MVWLKTPILFVTIQIEMAHLYDWHCQLVLKIMVSELLSPFFLLPLTVSLDYRETLSADRKGRSGRIFYFLPVHTFDNF